jgi:aryl-alcohol dehydrogenase-like predicted oxidoreductase
LSSRFRVITKVTPDILHIEHHDELHAVQRQLYSSVMASAEALAPARIDTLLLHRSDQRTAYGGVLWDAMQHLRERGIVTRIGVSALSPADALDALDYLKPKLAVPMHYNTWPPIAQDAAKFAAAAQARGHRVNALAPGDAVEL